MISVLFVAKNSVYKTMTDSAGEPLDCWDEERDAMRWPGGNPIVAHPPCRLWSKWMKHFSKADPSEKDLGRFAVSAVQRWGGVLEHPACSDLWKDQDLPLPGRRDPHGFSIALEQMWFGHDARKATWLYVCGVDQLPDIPFVMGEPVAHYSAVRTVKNPNMRRLSHHQRQGTPPAFARWLVETAERCSNSRRAFYMPPRSADVR